MPRSDNVISRNPIDNVIVFTLQKRLARPEQDGIAYVRSQALIRNEETIVKVVVLAITKDYLSSLQIGEYVFLVTQLG